MWCFVVWRLVVDCSLFVAVCHMLSGVDCNLSLGIACCWCVLFVVDCCCLLRVVCG